MIQYRKTWQNTARIARIIDNMVICRTFVRSVFFITTTRGDGFIDRSRGYRPRTNAYGIGGLQVFHSLRGLCGRYFDGLYGYIGLVQANEACCQITSRG